MIRLGRFTSRAETGLGQKLRAEIKEAKARGKGSDRKKVTATKRASPTEIKS